MATKYLEKFAQKIDKRQVDQVLQKLNKQRQAGSIRTVDEFLSRLQGLIRDLTSKDLSPTLNIFKAVEGEVIDSETYNDMLDRITDDFRSSFEEANNIDEVRKSHQALMRDIAFKNIRRAIDDLEAKVDLYDKKWNKYGAVSKSISSTFKEVGENRTRRNIRQSGTIFSDIRLGEIVEKDSDIEESGDRLTLGIATNEEYEVKKIRQIFDSSFPQSNLIVQLPHTNIKNIIDRQQYTYWIQSLLFESIQSYAKVKLELTLSTEKDINYIEIEPVTDKGIILEKIEYEDDVFSIQTLDESDTMFTSPVRINFSRIPTKKLFLTFRNENGIPIDFSYKENDLSLFNQTIGQSALGESTDISKVNVDFENILSSATTKNIIGIVPSTESTFSGYSYIFGIDNIRTGLTVYEPQSIYVSAPVKINKKVGQIFLEANETRPKSDTPQGVPENTSITYDGSDSDFYFSSIEYLIIKRDFDISGNILQTSRYPIIPSNKERIHHERLFLTEKSSLTLLNKDIGRTLLFTDKSAGDVKVYRNGSLLTYNVDWADVTSVSDKTPGAGDSMAFKVKIINPLIGDIYTVSYSPMSSTTRGIPKLLSAFSGSGVDIVDMKGDLSVRYVPGNTVLFLETDKNVSYSSIFLCIIMRNNSSRNALSAAVEDFELFIGTVEPVNNV